MQESSLDLAARVLNAQLHAEADLSSQHSVRSLARVAGLSPFHFQRVFKQVTGESVGRQLRRLRIERAAFLLRRSEVPIGEVATHCGFQSLSGFSHAFRQLLGTSPTKFRTSQSVTPFLRVDAQSSASGVSRRSRAILSSCPLTVWIEDVPEWQVAVRRFVGPVELMPSVWPAFIDQLRRDDVFDDRSTLLGIYSDDWDVPNSTRYRYDAGIVLCTSDIPEGCSLLTIPGGPVAMTSFSGTLWALDRAWRLFVDDWLPASGWQFRTTFAFDIYPPELMAGGTLRQIVRTLGGIRATLCVPVEASVAS